MIWNDMSFPALSWSLEVDLRQMYARPLRFVHLATHKAMKRHLMAHLYASEIEHKLKDSENIVAAVLHYITL